MSTYRVGDNTVSAERIVAYLVTAVTNTTPHRTFVDIDRGGAEPFRVQLATFDPGPEGHANAAKHIAAVRSFVLSTKNLPAPALGVENVAPSTRTALADGDSVTALF